VSNKNLYIIAGCNGAEKTTASFTILPEILGCKEFVNADEIAKGLSPFQPENVSFEAGRIMLKRIEEFLLQYSSFAFETTLFSKSYQLLVKRAKQLGYKITLLFFWLQTVELAKERVRTRVEEGGHNIPTDIIERRYKRGLTNLFQLYIDVVDVVLIYDNSFGKHHLIAQTNNDNNLEIIDDVLLNQLKKKYDN
jgi:predicted ABC-type ATPase